MDLKKILEFLNGISKRPGMYVSKYKDYDSVSSFIDGYLFAYRQCDQISFHEMIKWYSAKIDKELNIVLSAYFKGEYSNLAEEEVIQKYIESLIGFFEWKISQLNSI